MSLTRAAAVALVVASASLLPMHEASARCWHGGWGWHCGPGLLALPFIAAGTAVAVATAPVQALAGPPYYGPGYYGPPPAYYYPAPGYYYPPPMPLGGNDPGKSTNN
ncbi:MAG TPA: hypothetical protein VGG57_21220 [Stellaceae bacterium]|jgi:hypothetical protein